jgi:hypothetical protein
MISTLTFSGTAAAWSGSSATVISASLPSWSILRTWPTRAPLSSTSPNLASCSPARSALIVIVVDFSNVFW